MGCNPRCWSAAQETLQHGRSVSGVREDLRLLMYDAVYNGESVDTVSRAV